MTFDPDVLFSQITYATSRLLENAARLDDAAMREPSLLPGWSRGHVLTHVARNADGGTRLLGWALTGVESYEYPNLEARAAEIEDGAGRSAAELLDDVRDSAESFARAYAAMPESAWSRVVRWTAGQEHPAERAADARLCEVLVHHVDLRAGFTPQDWPESFTTDMLERAVRSYGKRPNAPALRLRATDTGRVFETSPEAQETRETTGSQASLLAWAMGRSTGDDLTGPLPKLPFLF